MKTVAEKNGFKVQHNGGKSWFVIDNTGHCWFATNTERKALNQLNKIVG